MVKIYLLGIILLCGCATPIESITYKQQGKIYTKTIDQIKKEVFTDEAYEIIKDIPFNEGPVMGVALAGGSTFLSRVYTTMVFCGWDDQILFNGSWLENKVAMLNKEPPMDSELLIMQVIHEYFHYLDVASRDGTHNFIDTQDFVDAYTQTAYDHRFHGIVRFTENRANGLFEKWFGIGDYAEHMAFVCGILAIRDGPDYLTDVYKKVLRKYQEKQ